MQGTDQTGEKELISIIVPVYNVDSYLKNCLDSILAQTYSLFEVVLINDGSTDKSQSICENYTRKDNRFILINKKNGGVSSARNHGLSVAKGKYITFVDSDDIIDERYLEILYRNIKITNADISMCTWSTKKRRFYKDNKNYVCWSRQETFINMFKTKKIDGSVCSKLYRRDCIKNLFFDEKLRLGEDQIFAVKAVENASKIVYQQIPLYLYFIRSTSAMNSKLDDRYWDVVYRAEWFVNKSNADFPELYGLFRKEEINIYVTMIIRDIKNGTEISRKIVEHIKPRIKNAKLIEFIKYCNFYELLRFILIKYFYRIAYCCIKLKK